MAKAGILPSRDATTYWRGCIPETNFVAGTDGVK
jgi:hypothetical protein